MKIFKSNTTIVILLITAIFFMLFLNLVLEKHPLFDLIKYVESNNFYWIIPIISIMFFGLWLFYRNMRKKIITERVEIFNATIHTIQDILQNSSSSMQLLILDMKDEGVNDELINRAEKNIEELKTVIETLAAIDPKNLDLKELNRNMTIIRMHE